MQKSALICILLYCLCAFHGVNAQTLLLHHADGAVTDFQLGTEAKVKFLDDHILLFSPAQNLNYEKTDVLTFTYEYLRSDINGDYRVDVADIATILDAMAGKAIGPGEKVDSTTTVKISLAEADANGDGVVDVADIATVLSVMASMARRTNALNQPEEIDGTIGEAFYIYRNDGKISAFFRDEIDSIGFSHYTADSVWFNKIASQVVFTPDSTYFIPLTTIDSVGFVTPTTKYKPGVIKLEDGLRQYVIRSDSLTLILSSNTPASILPHVGDKLITVEMDDILPVGFAGEVTAIENAGNEIMIICTSVALTDIFTTYYGASRLEWDGSRLLRRDIYGRPHKFYARFAPGKLTIPLMNNFGFTNSFQPNDELSFDLSEMKADVSVTPEITGTGFMTVTLLHGVNVSITVNGRYDLEENFSLKGGIQWKKDITFPPPYDRFWWPILPLADVYLKLGAFIQAGGEFAINQKWTQEYHSAYHWEYSSYGEEVLKPTNKVFPTNSSHSGEAAIKGYLGAGVFLEVGVDFIHTKKADIANANLRVDAGVNLEGNFVLKKSDMESAKTSTAIYEQLRDTELSLNWFYGVTANAKFFKWGISHDVNLGKIKLNNQGKIFSFALAPTFSDLKARYIKPNVDAKATVSCPSWLGGRCLKVDAGLVVKDENGEDVTPRLYGLTGYDGSQGEKIMEMELPDVPSASKNYRVYPHIKWMGVQILASPYTELDMGIPVEILKFEVNKATYYPNHYEYNGKKYSFRYRCTTYITLKDDTDVEDWGYVYIDPEGNESDPISLKQYRGTVGDPNYAYCRNESSSTVKLKGYVKYVDDEEIYYGEIQEFPIEYPEESSLTMTNCTFQGTTTNASYQGRTYKYKSTYRYLFTASGAYWLKVGTDETGTGWNNWTNLPNYTVSPIDGSNALTVNYYYDDKTFDGDYTVHLRGTDATHSVTHTTSEYVTYLHSDSQFTGCTFHSGSNARRANNYVEDTNEEEYNIVIHKPIF